MITDSRMPDLSGPDLVRAVRVIDYKLTVYRSPQMYTIIDFR